jgi:hypothetical protein
VQLFEVRRPVPLPVLAPGPGVIDGLRQVPVDPYGRTPWVTNADVRVQVTWTLSNLDTEAHNVEVLIDPWNEFGRYWPGLALVDPDDGEFLPNFSGIQHMYHVPGVPAGDSSRVQGTYTFEDLDELAVDFATVMNILEDHPPDEIELINHAFDPQNRSHRDVISRPWIPTMIAGLTGFDLGLRTREPANVAVEILVEVADTGTGRIRQKGEATLLIGEPDCCVTVSAGP